MGVPVDLPSNTPDRIFTASGSLRWVVFLFCPGRRLSSQTCSISGLISTFGGQPSTVAPKAGPWLSPQVVTRKRWPKLFMDIGLLLFTTPLYPETPRGGSGLQNGFELHGQLD